MDIPVLRTDICTVWYGQCKGRGDNHVWGTAGDFRTQEHLGSIGLEALPLGRDGRERHVKEGAYLNENLVTERVRVGSGGFSSAWAQSFPSIPPGQHHTCGGLGWTTAIHLSCSGTQTGLQPGFQIWVLTNKMTNASAEIKGRTEESKDVTSVSHATYGILILVDDVVNDQSQERYRND